MSDIAAPPPPELDWTPVDVVHTIESSADPALIIVALEVFGQHVLVYAAGGFRVFLQRHTGKRIRIHCDAKRNVDGVRSWRDPNEKPKPTEEISLIVEPPPTMESRLTESYLRYLEKYPDGDADTFLSWVRDEVMCGDLQIAANEFLEVGNAEKTDG